MPIAESTMPLTAGARLTDTLVIDRHVHRSSDADVYRVWSDEHLAHLIAKVLRPDRASRPGPQRRLTTEARVLGSFAHPSIVRPVEYDAERGMLVLEELRGQTLRAEFASTGDAAWLRICDIGLQLASALHYLHGRGLVHADLKPANAIAVDDGRVVLIDFSVARAPGLPTNGGVGTRQFVAPEQALGDGIDAAADIWGLGVILFRAASGALPFRDPGYPQTQHAAASVGEHRALPSSLVSAIDACLARSADRRPSAAQLHAHLLATRQQVEERLTRPLRATSAGRSGQTP